MSKAREKARAISCVSNFKQQMLGFEMYFNDYEDTFPDLLDGLGSDVYWDTDVQKQDTGTDAATYGNHQPYIAPYVGDKKLFACPSGTKNTTDKAKFGHDTLMTTSVHGKSRHTVPGLAYFPKSPSECAVIADGDWEWLSNDHAERLRFSHADMSTIGYLDGHASQVKSSALRGSTDAKIFGFHWSKSPVKFFGEK